MDEVCADCAVLAPLSRVFSRWSPMDNVHLLVVGAVVSRERFRPVLDQPPLGTIELSRKATRHAQ
jgi:hypothetical protein